MHASHENRKHSEGMSPNVYNCVDCHGYGTVSWFLIFVSAAIHVNFSVELMPGS